MIVGTRFANEMSRRSLLVNRDCRTNRALRFCKWRLYCYSVEPLGLNALSEVANSPPTYVSRSFGSVIINVITNTPIIIIGPRREYSGVA